MTVGKLTALCWVVFGVMSVAFMPLIFAEYSITGLPNAVHVALAVFIVGVLWWGPFGYGMYLAQVVMGNGDRGVLKRGIKGTARVLHAQVTGTSIGGRDPYGITGHRVYRYKLLVEIPGKRPYETYVMVASRGIPEGETVQVGVSRFNRKRVAIDVGQGGTKGYAPAYDAQHHNRINDSVGPMRPVGDHLEDRGHRINDGRPMPEDNRIRQLKELAKLHADGALSDAEFAAEKARILKQP